MAYGLKLTTPSGDIVLDENYRYNNNVMSGISAFAADSPAGALSPFIALSGADDADRFLIFYSSIMGAAYVEAVIGPSGFRFRTLTGTNGVMTVDYLVMRHG